MVAEELEQPDGGTPAPHSSGALAEGRPVRMAFFAREDEHFTCPLPYPEHFAEYDRVLPGAADRILARAEKEQTHRHAMETTAREHDLAEQRARFAIIEVQQRQGFALALLGQAGAFVLAAGALAGGLYVIAIGRDVAGLAAIITSTA